MWVLKARNLAETVGCSRPNMFLDAHRSYRSYRHETLVFGALNTEELRAEPSEEIVPWHASNFI